MHTKDLTGDGRHVRGRRRHSDDVVCLPDVEPALVDHVAGEDLSQVRRALTVPALRLLAEPWTPPDGLERAIALLVVTGLLTREGTAIGRPHLQLFGPEDIIDARRLTDDADWRTLKPSTVAIIDARVLLVARRWPQIFAAFTRRVLDGYHEHDAYMTINTLPRVEDRLMALFGHLAHRWGRVTPDGVELDLPLTHERLGRLIGAQRPTVTLALGELAEAEVLVSRHGGSWVLRHRGEFCDTV